MAGKLVVVDDPSEARDLVTAHGEPLDLEAGRGAGADAHIVKPFGFEHLASTVEELAGGNAR